MYLPSILTQTDSTTNNITIINNTTTVSTTSTGSTTATSIAIKVRDQGNVTQARAGDLQETLRIWRPGTEHLCYISQQE